MGMSFDAVAFGHQASALYGVSAPIANPDPADPGSGGIVNGDDQIELHEVAGGSPTPVRYSAELAKLLRNVAVETWTTGGSAELGKLSAQAIKAVGKSERQAVRDGFARFGVKSDAIQASLARLATYSVRDMAVALKRCSEWDMAKQAVEDAVEPAERDKAAAALDQLFEPPSEMRAKAAEYETLVSALSDLAQEMRDFAAGGRLPDRLRYGIDDLVITLESRVSELGTLGMHLVEMAGQAEERDDAYAEILNGARSMVDLAKGMGGVMHGNYDSVALRADKVADACDALGEMLGRVESQIVSGQDLAALQAVFVNADSQIRQVEGRLESGLDKTMDPKVLAGLRSKISQLRGRLNASRAIAVVQARRRFVTTLPQPFANCLMDTGDATLGMCPRFKRLYLAQKAFTDALMAYVADGGDPARRPALNRAIRSFAGLFDDVDTTSLVRELEGELKKLAEKDKLTVEGFQMFLDLKSLLAAAENKDIESETLIRKLFGVSAYYLEPFLEACRDHVLEIGAKSEKGVFLAGDVAKVVAGGGVMSDLLLASMYDVGIQSIDRDLVDRKGVQSKELGAGGVNSVKKITYPSVGGNVGPKTIVFKPDFLASVGNAKLSLFTDGYEGTPQALKLNLASNVIARRLGCGDRLTKVSAMFHQKQFGIGMTYAPGVEARDFWTKNRDVLCSMLGSENQEVLRKGLRIGNDIVRQTVDLQWLDLLSGQGDRHPGNYMIHFDDSTNPPSTVVMGIDNDMCMAKYRTGLSRLRLTKDRRQLVREKLIEIIKDCKIRYANQSAKKVADRMMRECFDKNGEIDFNRKPPLPQEMIVALGKAVGIWSMRVPKVMSQEMFDNLKAIDDDATGRKRQEFIDEMASLMPPANVDAFVARLDDLLTLVREGKVTAVPEVTDENPAPWLTTAKMADFTPLPFTNSFAGVGLPHDPQFVTIDHKAKLYTDMFVTRDCGEFLTYLYAKCPQENSI